MESAPSPGGAGCLLSIDGGTAVPPHLPGLGPHLEGLAGPPALASASGSGHWEARILLGPRREGGKIQIRVLSGQTPLHLPPPPGKMSGSSKFKEKTPVSWGQRWEMCYWGGRMVQAELHNQSCRAVAAPSVQRGTLRLAGWGGGRTHPLGTGPQRSGFLSPSARRPLGSSPARHSPGLGRTPGTTELSASMKHTPPGPVPISQRGD